MPGNGDQFRQRRVGEQIPNSAEYYNALSRMYLASQAKLLGSNAGDAAPFPDPGLVLIKNNTSPTTNVSRFGVLGVDGPLIDQATSDAEFKNRVVLTGSTPASANHTGKFVVALEPIAAGAIGMAVISGVVQVQVNMGAANDPWADIDAGNVDRLKSGPDGVARILWAASGAGVQWAIVAIGGYILPPGAKYQVLMKIDDNQTEAFDDLRITS